MPLRLNWFSPLPPERTAIAHYTEQLLPDLAQVADVTVWASQPGWNAELADIAEIVSWTASATDWRRMNRADINVYHIGNSPHHHRDILQLARRAPGLCVLHDTRLQHLVKAVLGRSAYSRAMYEAHGEPGLDAARALDTGRMGIEAAATAFPLTAYATRNARGVIIHDEGERDNVVTSTGLPVTCLELPYTAGPAPTPASRRGRVRLVQFGHIGPTRRLDKVLDALAATPGNEAFQLDVFGALWDRPLVERWIRERGLGGIVTLHGYVGEERLDDAIGQSELVLNLRYPSMGEASATQLRAWAGGRATLVTGIGWYSRLSPRAAYFVDPLHEVDDIRRHLLQLRDDPAPYWQSGDEGRRIIVEQHAPARYAAGLVDACQRIIADDPAPAAAIGRQLGLCLASFPPKTFAAADVHALMQRLAAVRGGHSA